MISKSKFWRGIVPVTLVAVALLMLGRLSQLSSNGAALPPPAPPKMPIPSEGLALWLKGEDVEADKKGKVKVWHDVSGMKNDVAVDGDGPTLEIAALNQQPGVRFDGNQKPLIRQGFTGLSTGKADRSIFIVARYDGLNWCGGLSYGDVQPARGFSLGINPDGITCVDPLYIEVVAGGNSVEGTGFVMQDTVMQDSQLTLSVNGTIVGNGAYPYSTGRDFIIVGANLDSTRHVPQVICEIITYNRAVTDAERRQVWQYLTDKYFPPQ